MAFIIAIRFALIAPSSWAYDIGDKRGQTADTGRLLYRRLDVTKPDDWRATVSEAEAVFGKLDILVSNAGVCSMAGLLDEDEGTWDRTVAVNQTGHGMPCAPLCRQWSASAAARSFWYLLSGVRSGRREPPLIRRRRQAADVSWGGRKEVHWDDTTLEF
jgi:NAD(P)-dependent dehydrogenase (short-subunit alcohol dehydrogenase family)